MRTVGQPAERKCKSTHKLVVRSAQLADSVQLVNARAAFLTELDENADELAKVKMKKCLQEYIKLHMGTDLFISIATTADELLSVAFVEMASRPGTFSEPMRRVGWISDVYTYPKARQQGLARQVVTHLINSAKKKGVTEFSLDATRAGIPLYRSLGFSSVHDPYERMSLHV